jgi:hypothetical protein
MGAPAAAAAAASAAPAYFLSPYTKCKFKCTHSVVRCADKPHLWGAAEGWQARGHQQQQQLPLQQLLRWQVRRQQRRLQQLG